MAHPEENLVFLYHAESVDLLDEMESSLLYIQQHGFDKEHINTIFRTAHTIKGGAATFGYDILVDFSHTAENLLDDIRSEKKNINNDLITFLLKIKDHFNTMIESIIQNDCEEIYDQNIIKVTKEYKEYLENYDDSQVKEEPKPKSKDLSDIPKIGDQEKDLTTQPAKIQTNLLKIESKKIDAIINLLGEMVITTAGVMEHSKRINDKPLKESVDNLYKILEELREASMKSRMIPIADTFKKFQRTVRDISLVLDKNIDLHIEGADTELDRIIIEKISDPLMHLVRNAVDHGIETIQEREDKNKPSIAHIILSASHEAGNIVIEVKDDGRGLDPQKILDKAVEKNLISKDDKLHENEIFNLIMQPGFSTADLVTDLSGRGVGMDVVKKNIDQLGGSIDINSKLGQGMTVTIKLRLTLAIIDGFMIKLNNDPYIIPLEMITECKELTDEYKKVVKQDCYINLRDHILPILDLKEFFGYERIKDNNTKENIVVVSFGILKVGLIVDELLGEFQTVIKPMSKVFKNLKGISGATILGNGSVTPILDVPVLLKYANQKYK
ncbi:MAG: chemotaxis protein CheA [Campylobacterota bacterium]|nr:chemotaxis protein CheA [Campylobacterota bacterium]